MHRTLRIALLVALLAAGLPGHAFASGWGFKLWAASTYVAPLSQSDQNFGGVTAAVKASNELGYELGGEFRTGLLGFALDRVHVRQELKREDAGRLGSADFDPVSATLYLHLPTPLLELYGGPTLAYAHWGDLELPAGGTEPLHSRVALGLSAGGDWSLLPLVAITAGVRWLKLDAEPARGGTIAVNPLVSHIGLALRF